MRPVDTKKVRRILRRLGCTKEDTLGSHEKWRTPGGISCTIVAAEKQQSPGLIRSLQSTFEPELGEKWFERELGR